MILLLPYLSIMSIMLLQRIIFKDFIINTSLLYFLHLLTLYHKHPTNTHLPLQTLCLTHIYLRIIPYISQRTSFNSLSEFYYLTNFYFNCFQRTPFLLLPFAVVSHREHPSSYHSLSYQSLFFCFIRTNFCF